MPSDITARDLRGSIDGARRHICDALAYNHGLYDNLYDEEECKRQLLDCLVHALADLEGANCNLRDLIQEGREAHPTPAKVACG